MSEKEFIKYLLSKQIPKEKIRNAIIKFREKFNNLNPKENFNDYVKIMFSETVASCDFQESQHTKALIQILQLRADMKLLNNNLIISIPPGHTKTLLCNILYCSWILGKYPHLRQLLGTNSQTEGNKRNLELRDLMQSEKYKNIFPNVFLTGEDVKWLKTNHKGGRLAVTTDVAMRFTGTDADELIIDDPNDTTSTLIEFEKVKDWFDKKAKRRLRRGNLGFLCIMQRVGLQDLTEHLLKTQQDILHIVLPAESINDYSLTLPLKDGSIHQINISQGYLWNDKDIIKMYEDAKKNNLVWQTQYQQNPIEDETAFFVNKNSLSYYSDFYYEYLPHRNDVEYFMTCDTALKTGKANDFTVCLLFATFYKNVDNTGIDQQKIIFVVDMLRGKWIDPIPEVYAFYQKWKDFINYAPIYIEDKVNGTALIHELRNRYITSIGISRTNDIESRMGVVNNYITSGLLHLPTKLYINAEYSHNYPIQNDFVNDFERELLSFRRQNTKTRTGHDDIVSCLIDGLAIAYNPQSLKLIKS